MIIVAGLCEDTHSLLLSISGSPKDPCGWPMRRYLSPCFSGLYLETGYAKIPIHCISLYRENPCGWPMRIYPSPCFSLYREALKIHLAGLCEDTHPRFSHIGKHIMIIVAGLCEDIHPPPPCFSLYREALKILVAGLCEDTHPPASLYIWKP